METFWRTKGKRIAAWFMIALIVATTIPFGSIRASADDDTQNEKNAVAITETDADTNASYMEKKTLTDDQVSANTVDMGEIILTKEDTSYSVTAKGKNSDGADIEIAGTVEVKDNVVTAAPKEGYEITDVKVQKDNTDWKPDDAENDWWKSKLDESGAFKYEGFEDSTLDADYVFTIIFAKKQFTFTYTISQNGKLILNSGADNDKVEITAENENKDGKENVPYTNDEYKIKAAVTDTDYHLTSFKVDNEEQIAVDRIQNDLDECEYTFEKGITSSHSIEVTAVIDTC